MVRLVRLADTGGKTGGENGPPLANSPPMHSKVVRKDPKTHFVLNAKIISDFLGEKFFKNPNIRRTQFDQKFPRPPEMAMAQTDTHT